MWLEALLLLAMLSAAVLYDCSRRCRYLMRQSVLYLGGLVVGLCVTPLGLRRPCDPRNSLLFTRPLRAIGWLLGVEWQVRGAERLCADTACVVVANHRDALDVLGMVELWPHFGRLVTVMKREIWLGFPFALGAWLCGQIFIDRSNPARARQSLLHAQQRMCDERLAVWFFPEGTRNRGAGLLPFKKGAFHMAVSAQVPVVPIVFGPYQHFLEPREWRFEPGRAVVQALEPVPTAGLTAEDVPRLLDQVQRSMAEVYGHLSDELLSKKAA
ncbi:1-acyl-sn-glycerol-3-phosphate acyltransferase alpha-like [Amphibalanus amphitrite]|uniref:1-acyl-sn-glycerol-3-phosphate acyltransferase alpha-like n=1 Tax=Amphibalanus amphitrite TaxID=1232801 RepID=UPI001C927AB7|nr:1-acyl-sn-glycerol-3-phosphate acyltransferase alpha-like [Amphibalanus amphitrite]XP_043210107.1 1-acyl-sn-glycerol-3-phosphate acyltransferase alpha-like [Amphibalanus amphitrite]